MPIAMPFTTFASREISIPGNEGHGGGGEAMVSGAERLIQIIWETVCFYSRPALHLHYLDYWLKLGDEF